MAMDLRNLKNKIVSKDEIKGGSQINGKQNLEADTPKFISSQVVEKNKSNIIPKKEAIKQNHKNIAEKNQDDKLSKSQWILLIYTTVFLAIVSAVIAIDWASIWQLPKSIIFIFGISGFLILSSTLWIFGGIKHIVRINLGDISLGIFGVIVLIISFVNPNQIAIWGSANRIFDSGIFGGYLILFYILLKVFFDKKAFNIIILLFACISEIGLLVGALAIYIPNFISLFPILTKLQTTGTWLTESPQELVFISLLVFNIIFIFFFQNQSRNISSKILAFVYYLALFTHIVLLIRLPDYSMYVLTVLSLVINTIFYINKLLKTNLNQLNNRLIISRISFIYGVIALVLISLAIIRPFQNNTQFKEYSILTVPNIDTTLSITKQSLVTNTWFGSGSIIYAWNKFTPSVIETQISDFSFETLYNEIFNIVVRNGLIVSSIIVFLGIWILGGVLRLLFIYKTIPIETYTLIIAIIGLFLIPFAVITKVLFILILVLWSNIFTKYFKPIFNLNLDINKIPASISSLFTFIMLFGIATILFVSTKFYNILQSQEYIVKASKAQNNLAEQLELLAKAQNKSPYIIEYVQFYIPALIQQINQEANELVNSTKESETRNIDGEKQNNLQDKINIIQSIIDEYKKRFPSDTRVIYWQLDLYSTIQRYGEIDENDYLSVITKGRELQKNSLYWDIYEAQYYARQAQKEQKVNMEQLDKSKAILNSLIEKNVYFLQAYQNYYDILSLNQEYKEQINIILKYINNSPVDDRDMVYNLALAYQNDKQYDQAIIYYNKLLETFPDYTNVYFKLGEIYEIQNKKQEAIKQYEKALELDPKAELAGTKLEKLKK